MNYRALEGDANGDFVVDVSDFNIWNEHRFGPGDFTEGDFNGDGVVDVGNFNIWNANKFTSVDRVSLVPEPAAWLLLALAGIAATSWARRPPGVSRHVRAGNV